MSSIDPPDGVQVTLTSVVGYVIQVERKARGLSQSELALAAGIHPMTLSKIERGSQGDVGMETLQRLAAALSAKGQSLRASDILKRAEELVQKIRERQQAGDLPRPETKRDGISPAGAAAAVFLGGAALAGIIAWLASQPEKPRPPKS